MGTAEGAQTIYCPLRNSSGAVPKKIGPGMEVYIKTYDCLGDTCGFWDHDSGCCAVLSIARELSFIRERV